MTHLKENIYAIEVPEDAGEFEIHDKEGLKIAVLGFMNHTDKFPFKLPYIVEVLPSGNWQIIGTVTPDNYDFDITEVFNCPEFNHLLREDIELYFKMHEHKLRELLASKGLHFENPYGKEEPDYTCVGEKDTKELHSKQDAWQEAENKLIRKLLIIKKL